MPGPTDPRFRPARHMRAADAIPAPVVVRSRLRTALVVLGAIIAAPFILIAFLASFGGNR